MPGEAVDVRFGSDGLVLRGRARLTADAGTALVLLSGIGFHSFEYEPLAEQLAARGVSSLSFDFRGHGRSDGPRGAWTLAELAADAGCAVGALLERHPGPVAIFGNSLGAMVAILAATGDRRVGAVVASNCPARIGSFLLTAPRRAALCAGRLLGPAPGLRVSIDHFYDYGRLIDDPAWLEAIRHDPRIADARRLTLPTYRELLSWDGPAAVRRLRTPILVLQGAADRLQPPRQSELLFAAANEPKALELLPTGHLPHLEDPCGVCDVVTRWIASGTTGHAAPLRTSQRGP